MDNSSSNSRGQLDQNSLGILSMDNLKVFGDESSLYKSRASSDVHDRLKVERQRALQALENPRARIPHGKANDIQRKSEDERSSSTLSIPIRVNENSSVLKSINISDLITDVTIDLNSSSSFAVPQRSRDANISFEPAEITGRSTLCQNMSYKYYRDDVNRISSVPKKVISVADILKSSFVEKARLLEKKLKNSSNADFNSTNSSRMEKDSISCAHSLPRTADMSQRTNLTLNGGGDFCFSRAEQEFNESNFSDAEFAPAELMQSKLLLGEISWAQKFTAMPTATLSKQAMEKIAAPIQTPDIETSVSNSEIAGDPDFSVGKFFETRSENIWNIVKKNNSSPLSSAQPLAVTNSSMASVFGKTPQADNKTYTKEESNAKLERNIMKKKQQEKINLALQTKQSPNSELLSLSAIDRALSNFNFSTDTSTIEVVNKLRGRDGCMDEDKENTVPTLTGNEHTDTMSFTESILNCSDFIKLQQSVAEPRTPLTALAQPEIVLSHVVDDIELENDADIDEWPSTPVKLPTRRVRRTKSPSVASDDIQKLPYDEENNKFDENKTPVNKIRTTTAKRNPSSLSSTRLDGCDALPSSTECDFGISPNLGPNQSPRARNATLVNQNVSPLSSPRSCLSSPLLDSTTSTERHLLMPGAARKITSSPANSEASSTNGFMAASHKAANGTQLSAAARSMSRCSNSSEFSHRDGKLLPLKVTHTSISWGSTKLRTDVRKSMQVKNTSNKRLVMRLGIQGPGFQLVGADTNTITMQAMECRTISITFCPTVCGAAVGALSFYAPMGAINSNQPSMEIPLYGYGGNSAITIQGLLKGPVGASFITIGDVCELSSGPLMATFKFYNKGPLTAYAGMTVDSTVLLKPRLSEAFEIKPNKVIIPPYSEEIIQIIFRPNREDIKNILKKIAHVLTLANLRIFCGDEPNRQRMRALVERMTSNQREQLTSSMLDSIWCNFPHEKPIRNIATLNEPPEFILDLVTMVRIVDVALTLNRDFDESAETSSIFFPEADETVLFRTICAANSPTPTQPNILEPVHELLEADTTSVGEQNFSVQPASIAFDLSDNKRGGSVMLNIKNSYKSPQYFEVACNLEEILKITPKEGYIAPDGGQLRVEVQLLRFSPHDILEKELHITVSMENEQVHVPVKFKF